MTFVNIFLFSKDNRSWYLERDKLSFTVQITQVKSDATVGHFNKNI